ncbi:hypothetical protein LVK10_13285, partial [Tenacibaculum maritimum]|nr:hypothetical protein [Tenacibaculum maritimum]MCD9580182.1 hypothetical protein [Tenacibaculum maritimum]MCD9614866.1 hypothetical protein [Tenacibaculum maritimum]
FLPDFKSSTSITLKSLSYFFAIIQIYYLWTLLIRLNKCRHSRSVNTITQSESSNAKAYPKNGEMDIMPYYTDNPPLFDYNRFIAHEKDLLSLLWLTKVELK